MLNLIILGSTGSIGTQALEVIKQSPSGLKVFGLACNSNISLLEKQVKEFSPKYAAIFNEDAAEEFKKKNLCEVFVGPEGVKKLAQLPEADRILGAIVGSAGIEPTFAAIDSGKDIALANKEALVCAGRRMIERARETGSKIIPVDSEHSAIFQCINGDYGSVEKIVLTCSGGPFRNKSLEDLKRVTKRDALNHPTWSMGEKITIDSATLMNKALEIIEARFLFFPDFPDEINWEERIEVVIHPESIVHSFVYFKDGSILAQLGLPDMKVPIHYALHYPSGERSETLSIKSKRVQSFFPRLDLANQTLHFEKPNFEIFKGPKLAYEALKAGDKACEKLNMKNEAAVQEFLDGKISFLEIYERVESA